MLAYPAQLYRLDILHGKFGVMLASRSSPHDGDCRRL